MSRKVPEESDFAPMAEADELCDLLFLWLKKKKQCKEKLLALAKELESVHEISTVSQVAGSLTSVVALSTAGIVTFLTGGLATPLLVATTVGTVAGAAVDIGSTAIEGIMSGSTMNEAKNIIREDEKIGKDFQEAVENLKKKCEVQQNGAHGPTDEGCEVATQIMGALARRNNIKVPLYFLRSSMRSRFDQNSGGSHAAGAVSQQLTFAAVTFLCYHLGIECFKKGLKSSAKGLGRSVASTGAKGLGKSVASSGAKGATKAGSKLLGVIGFGISLYSLISSCEEMVNSNQGTMASRALRNAASEIQKAIKSLEDQLEAMKKLLQETEQEQQKTEEIKQKQQKTKKIKPQQQKTKETEQEQQDLQKIKPEQQKTEVIKRVKQKTKETEQEENSKEETKGPPAVNVGMLNVRSILSITNMKKKRLNINNLITKHDLDVFLMIETWLENETAAVALREAAPQNFESHQESRVERGGGVAIQFSQRLRSDPIPFDSITVTTFEYVATALRHEEWDEGVLFINVYRPPRNTYDELCKFVNELEKLLKEASTLYNCVIVAGDFNVNLGDIRSLKPILFQIFTDRYNLKQHVNEPTHNQGGILDLVFSRNVEVFNVKVNDDEISDHYTVYFSIRPKNEE